MQSEQKYYLQQPVATSLEEWETLTSKDILKEYEFMGRLSKYKDADAITFDFCNDTRTMKGKKNPKKFFDASIPSFVNYCLALPLDERTYNIIISENLPSFGFLDVEFFCKDNPGKDISSMLRVWLERLFEIWPTYFPEDPAPSITDFLFLTASNSNKASMHVHGPFNYAWENVYHWKALVSSVNESLQKLVEEGDATKEQKDCFINRPSLKDKQEAFVDMGIFNHNQNFRMYGQTKVGEERYLKVSEEFELPKFIQEIPEGEEREKKLLALTIVNAVPPNIKKLSFPINEAYTKILPRNAFNRTDGKKPQKMKLSFVIYQGGHTKTFGEEDPQTTHKEVRPNATTYHRCDTLTLYDQICSEKKLYYTYEYFSQETILVLETTKYPGEWIPKLQSVVADKFGPNELHLVQLLSGFRIYWPGVQISLSEASEIIKEIREAVGGAEAEMIIDPYSRNAISLLGSFAYCPEDKGSKVDGTWVAKYNEVGEKYERLTYEKLGLLKLLSVRK